MSRTFDNLQLKSQVNQCRSEELAKPEPNECVLAVCDLFDAVAAPAVRQQAYINSVKTNQND